MSTKIDYWSKILIFVEKFDVWSKISKNLVFGPKCQKSRFSVRNVENINIWSKTLKSRWYVIGTSNDDDVRTDH